MMSREDEEQNKGEVRWKIPNCDWQEDQPAFKAAKNT
jgi:hypothetical protein